MNLHQLRLFCAVVERGSFALASRELFISQPALSIQVRRLERGVGLELLRRTRGGVVPTAAGAELYEAATALLAQAARVELRIAALRAGEGGALALGVSPTGALQLLAALVGAFSREHPAVRVSIEVEPEQRLYERLRAGSLDAGLDRGPTVPTGLASTTLLDERFEIVCAAAHPRAADGRIIREEFLATPLFLLQHATPGPSFMESWLLTRDLLPARVTRLPSVEALKCLVEANLGLTILSHGAAAREIAGGYLAPLAMDGFDLRRPLVLLTRRGTRSPLEARWLAFARKHARDLAGAQPTEATRSS